MERPAEFAQHTLGVGAVKRLAHDLAFAHGDGIARRYDERSGVSRFKFFGNLFTFNRVGGG